jgi:hypothetical protein
MSASVINPRRRSESRSRRVALHAHPAAHGRTGPALVLPAEQSYVTRFGKGGDVRPIALAIIFSMLLATAAAMASTSWIINEGKSPIDDSPEIIALRYSEYQNGEASVFAIRCRNFRTSILVGSNEYWNIPTGSRVNLQYRVNALHANEQEWISGPNDPTSDQRYSSAFLLDTDQVRKFIRDLPSNGKIFFRVYDHQDVWHDMLFSLDGLDDVRARIGATCK